MLRPSRQNPSFQESPQRPRGLTKMTSNTDYSENKERIDLILSADLQKFRHQLFISFITTIDQPQLTLPLLETEHLENLAYQRQNTQNIKSYYFMESKAKSKASIDSYLSIRNNAECKFWHLIDPLAARKNTRSLYSRRVQDSRASGRFASSTPAPGLIKMRQSFDSNISFNISKLQKPSQHRDLDHLPQTTRSRKRK